MVAPQVNALPSPFTPPAVHLFFALPSLAHRYHPLSPSLPVTPFLVPASPFRIFVFWGDECCYILFSFLYQDVKHKSQVSLETNNKENTRIAGRHISELYGKLISIETLSRFTPVERFTSYSDGRIVMIVG